MSFFFSSEVTQACLNAVGKVPVRRDVLMMCVSAGKSEGEISWRRCEGIGSRVHVGWLERRSLDPSVSVRGQKVKKGVLAVDVVGLSSCVCGAENWLLIDLVLFVKNVAKSSAVKEVVGWWSGTEERVECFEELACVRCAVDLVVEVWGLGSMDFSRERWKQRLIGT